MAAKKLQCQANRFESLPDDLVIDILARTVEDVPETFDSIKLSCKKFNRLAIKPDVVKFAMFWHLREQIPHLLPKYKKQLKSFALAGNLDAQMMLGTKLFFNDNKRIKGLKFIKAAADNEDLRASYILWIAKILSNDESGRKSFHEFLKTDENARLKLYANKIDFRAMIVAEAKTMVPWNDVCRVDRNHDAVVGALEFRLQCPKCIINVELYKLFYKVV